jgi:hypothetical protein
VVEKVFLGQIFSKYFAFSLQIIIPSMFHIGTAGPFVATHSFIHLDTIHRSNIQSQETTGFGSDTVC